MSRIDTVAKNFEPAKHESAIYQNWLIQDCFKATVDPGKKPYTIVMPPPNITGQLHMGHALDITLQDILIRFKRMQGYAALWLPGTDHASIATEARIVEAMRQEGLDKTDLGRDKFLARAWEWKEVYGNRIVEQIKRMGSSCDWSRLRFTMDEGLSKAVEHVFIDLYNKDYIYRGERIVNWCPHCLTSISDAEVEHEDCAGHFWHIRYPLTDGSGALELATTRPETLLGDTAVAVHPADARYRHLIGQTVVLPLVGREIPVIADEYVDPEFGTGVVKITPAHDPNDFEVGERHQLPLINVLTEDARINEQGGKYTGLTREEARQAVVHDLEAGGYLLKTEEINHAVGSCYRCDTIVEPRVSMQWFVAMKEMAKAAIEAVEDDRVRFIPKRFEKVYFHWMENIRDWCISRQLWWGHRIPAWYCADCDEIIVSVARPASCRSCGGNHLNQDEDTLDTWFSSALWPFSTLGWPEDTEDYRYFYPTNVLVTGYDIITFWVSRMIFSALEQTGREPFDEVFIHGIVRDEKGRKMSKSLGNGIDPLEVIDQYGADALRYALISGTSPGNDLRYQEQKVEAGRNFINKVWNAFRFVLMNLDADLSDEKLAGEMRDALNQAVADGTDLRVEDRWILTGLEDLIEEVTRNLEQFELGIALGKIYNFLWDSYCDWYIEMVKPRLRAEGTQTRRVAQAILLKVLRECLILLHPYMPYFTEAIFDELPTETGFLMTQNWPQSSAELKFPQDAKNMDLLIEVIRAIRNLRAEMNVAPARRSGLLIVSQQTSVREAFTSAAESLGHLAGIASVQAQAADENIPAQAVAVPFSQGTAYLPLEDLIDLAQEKQRLLKEAAKYRGEMERVSRKLANQSFVTKAPETVVEKERQRYREYEEMARQAEQRASELKA